MPARPARRSRVVAALGVAVVAGTIGVLTPVAAQESSTTTTSVDSSSTTAPTSTTAASTTTTTTAPPPSTAVRQPSTRPPLNTLPPPPPSTTTTVAPALVPARPGERGAKVSQLQWTLALSGFWLGWPDGVYGGLTSQAVMAFQKYVGLPRTGVADQGTINALLYFRGRRPVARSTSGTLVEVDKTRQLMFIIRNGRVEYVANTSTGSEKPYVERDKKTGQLVRGDAKTPEGRFRVYFERPNGWWDGSLGRLYRPKYVYGGVAIHGSSNVPAYPASHGCMRVTPAFMDMVWAYNLVPLGTTVWIYR